MRRIPGWLRCGECLWWEPDNLFCSYTQSYEENAERGYFDRCPHWTCRRCLEPWHRRLTNYYSSGYQPFGSLIINHFHCPIQGRKNPEPVGATLVYGEKP